MVLFYSENELKAITQEIISSGLSPLNFIENQIINSECFSKYKENPKLFSWQSLIYRVSHKLPFIDIKVQQDKGLQSLFDTNKSKIIKKEFEELDNLLDVILLELSDEELKDISAEDILEKLLIDSEEDEN